MGKSEVASVPIQKENSSSDLYMSFNCNGTYKIPIFERPSLEAQIPLLVENFRHLVIPEDVEVLTNQVAGHTNDGKSIGILKQKDTVLKPVSNGTRGMREVEFYEQLNITQDSNLKELKDFVPKYFGTKTVPVDGKPTKCIILEDLTADYMEPCIMDIKIGKRTWDPEAKFNKIAKEEQKYRECKRDLSFCIPGFQVYKIRNNQLVRYDKNYGKTLNKETVPEALKIFLNGDSGFCRSLLMQILVPLWRIQHWARSQRSIRLYSSSILIIYDARRLKECLRYDGILKPKLKLTRSGSLYRPLSLAVLNHNSQEEKIPTGFSGQLTDEGPILTPMSRKKFSLDIPAMRRNSNNVWQQSFHNLKRTHSFQNNYDKNVQSKKRDYNDMLEDLCCEHKTELWANVKIIDFAHVFPGQNCDIDGNFLQGIESLVKLLEDFLIDSE